MIRHILFRSFHPGTTPDQIAAVEQRTRDFIQIKGVVHVECGPNLLLSPKDEGLTHVTIIDLEDAGALESFMSDPTHAASVAQSSPHIARTVIADLEVLEIPS